MIRILILAIACYSLAIADRDGGPYIGVGYGKSKFGDNQVYENLKQNSVSNYHLYAGAAINKHLSVEISYAPFGEYELEDNKSLEATIISLSTLVQYPFYNDMFSIFAKGGVGHIDLNSDTDTGFTFIVGAGVSYRYSEYLSIKAGYDYYPFDYEDSNEMTYSMDIEYIYGAIEVQF